MRADDAFTGCGGNAANVAANLSTLAKDRDGWCAVDGAWREVGARLVTHVGTDLIGDCLVAELRRKGSDGCLIGCL